MLKVLKILAPFGFGLLIASILAFIMPLFINLFLLWMRWADKLFGS
jgi:hypothetical protein